jgi:uncharacterized protein (TIGR02145 family)
MKTNGRTLILVIFGFILLIQFGCKKDNPESLAFISTVPINDIGASSALSGGNISNDGGSPITSRGVCWNTNSNPTILNNKTSDGTGIGLFTSSLTGLLPMTTYYVRSYATNNVGVSYGNQEEFTTGVIPIADFTSSHTTILAGQEVQFTDQSVGSPTVWSWTFGDGSVSSSQHPSHKYLTEGNHTVSLTVQNVYGTNTLTRTNCVIVKPKDGGIIFNPNLIYGSISDRDGNTYKTIKIGTQEWMAENLRTRSFKNGDFISTTKIPTADISQETEPKYQWAYDGKESNVIPYGRLYTWYAVNDKRGICPEGWHVPNEQEWDTLTTYLRPNTYNSLIETGSKHWLNNLSSTNSSGFTAIGSGCRRETFFMLINVSANYWTSQPYSGTNGVMRTSERAFTRGVMEKTAGLAVRCIKD